MTRVFRVAGRLSLAAVAVAVAGAGVEVLRGLAFPSAPAGTVWVAPAVNVPAVPVQPGSVIPAASYGAARAFETRAEPLRAWADRLSGPTGIPARALLAYGNADSLLRVASAGCGLSWPTLAAIGRVESNHGLFGGASLGADGRSSTPIVGVPLDGSGGVRSVPDTDGGVLDGDRSVDRAVGPMQFIPSTWRKWATDGNRDGVADPQQFDDAALAAGRYLCAGGRDLATAPGWWSAVLSYNNSVPYGQKVFGLAESYATAATRAG